MTAASPAAIALVGTAAQPATGGSCVGAEPSGPAAWRLGDTAWSATRSDARGPLQAGASAICPLSEASTATGEIHAFLGRLLSRRGAWLSAVRLGESNWWPRLLAAPWSSVAGYGHDHCRCQCQGDLEQYQLVRRAGELDTRAD